MIYHYVCKLCDKQYSVVVVQSTYSTNCPYCGSTKTKRIRKKYLCGGGTFVEAKDKESEEATC